MRTRRWARAGAVIPLAVTAVGCGALGAGGPDCTDIGARSGVRLVFDTEPGTTYRLCAGAVCSRSGTGDGREMLLAVDLPGATGPKRVAVRFTGTPQDAPGTAAGPAVDERVDVTLDKWQPNGPGCEPTAYQARLGYEPGKGLFRKG
ncbi:hypothetical protein [Actinacidiphila glaucinigra]|uniref:hypothetical protein n=1 Tax=Actinacidiphila glaucinigra TaxID=235986 RepID=UPI0036727B06